MPQPASTPAVEPARPPGTHKWCAGCGEKLPIDQFHLDSSTEDGRRRNCKACRAALHAEEEAKKEIPMDPRLAKLEEQGLEALDHFADGGSFSPHSKDVLDAFMRYLGGHSGLVKLTMAHYYHAKPGSAERGRTLDKIFRLIMAQEDNSSDLAKIDQSQLEALLLQTAGRAGLLPGPLQNLDHPDTLNGRAHVKVPS
jgi:hypothetical protein